MQKFVLKRFNISILAGIIFYAYTCSPSYTDKQYLNCRGDAPPPPPHRELASPHRDSVTPIEVRALVEQKKKGLAARINLTNSGRI